MLCIRIGILFVKDDLQGHTMHVLIRMRKNDGIVFWFIPKLYHPSTIRKLKSILHLFVLICSTENFCSHAIKALFFLVFWTKQIVASTWKCTFWVENWNRLISCAKAFFLYYLGCTTLSILSYSRSTKTYSNVGLDGSRSYLPI